MRGWKCAVFVGLLLAVTAVKLLFPQQNARLREQAQAVLEPGEELGMLVTALGRSLREEGPESGLLAALRYAEL